MLFGKALRWALLIVDVLLWTIVAPPVATVLWAVLYTGQLTGVSRSRLWLDTPWDLLLMMFVTAHRVRIIDADGADSVYLPAVRSLSGAVLVPPDIATRRFGPAHLLTHGSIPWARMVSGGLVPVSGEPPLVGRLRGGSFAGAARLYDKWR